MKTKTSYLHSGSSIRPLRPIRCISLLTLLPTRLQCGDGLVLDPSVLACAGYASTAWLSRTDAVDFSIPQVGMACVHPEFAKD